MPRLIVRAYGQLTPAPDQIASTAWEELYSVFLARSELMRWTDLYAAPWTQPTSPLWAMNDADLNTDPDDDELGWAQVGLDVGLTADLAEQVSRSEREAAAFKPAPFPIGQGRATDPVVAIPPLIQCLDDALRRYGRLAVTGYQTEVHDPSPRQQSLSQPLVGVLSWFNVTTAEAQTRASVTVASDVWSKWIAEQVVADFQQSKTGPFSLGPFIRMRQGGTAEVELPEWSPAAAGWVIATLVDAVLVRAPLLRGLSVRVARAT